MPMYIVKRITISIGIYESDGLFEGLFTMVELTFDRELLLRTPIGVFCIRVGLQLIKKVSN